MEFRFARDAFRYLIKTYKIKEIYMPYYLCDVMRHTAFEENCKILFYHIDDNFYPKQNFSEDKFILYPNYFGVCDTNVDNLVKIYPKLIVDNAHAFYATPKGFASFNSAKKFLPVESGANLWIGEAKNLIVKDYNRHDRFINCHEILQKTNQLNIDISKGCIPFCYPYLAKDIKSADKLVEKLTKQGKTIYRYWNSLPKTYNEYKFYSRLVPIPLDTKLNFAVI